MPWLLPKGHVRGQTMNIRIQKMVVLFGVSAVAFSQLSTAPTAIAGQKTKKQSTEITQDQFTITLSTVPYSSDPNSAFVRNHCDPAKKKKKPSS